EALLQLLDVVAPHPKDRKTASSRSALHRGMGHVHELVAAAYSAVGVEVYRQLEIDQAFLIATKRAAEPGLVRGANARDIGRVPDTNLIGMLGGRVGMGKVGEEKIPLSGGAHGVAEEAYFVVQVGQRAAQHREDARPRAHVALAEQRILGQVVKVAVQRDDAL